jgi:hypothetical protein
MPTQIGNNPLLLKNNHKIRLPHNKKLFPNIPSWESTRSSVGVAVAAAAPGAVALERDA